MCGYDGLEVMRRLRAASVRTPVIVLTALAGSLTVSTGSSGADDYLVKPFAFAELARGSTHWSAVRRSPKSSRGSRSAT